MIRFIFAALLILQAAKAQEFLTSLNFDTTTGKYEEFLKCYLKGNFIKGSLQMTLGIYDIDYAWASTYNLSDPKTIYEIYPNPVHVILVYISGEDHSLFGQLVAKAVKDQPIKAIWIMVFFKTNCAELKGFLRDMRNAVGQDVTVGVATTIQSWSYSFSKEGCPQVPQQYPLFYMDNQQQFYPFAGWKKAEYFEESRTYVQMCKYIADFNQLIYFSEPKK